MGLIRKIANSLARYTGIPDQLRQVEDAVNRVQIETGVSRRAHLITMHDQLLWQHPHYADPKRLLRYAVQVNSQNGEDGIIEEVFNRIGTESRIFIEIGIGNGLENNTAWLLAQGWSGYWLEGDSAYEKTVASLPETYRDKLKTKTTFVTRENVVGLLDELGAPKEIDLLSLDIDQNTWYVWEAMKAYRPRLAVIEYNGSITPGVDWKVHYDGSRAWDITQVSGGSLKAMENLGRQLGYSLVGCDFIGVNAFFVRDDLLGDHFAAPYTSENHYEPIRFHLINHRGHPTAFMDGVTED